MGITRFTARAALGVAVLTWLLANPAGALLIDNDIPVGTLGHWDVDVGSGGEGVSARITANRYSSGDVYTEDVIYDYFTYIDLGPIGGATILSEIAPFQPGSDPDEARSMGSFVGSGGNLIAWEANSTIPDGGSAMTTVYKFSTTQGTLGNIRLYQYLDEDVEGFSNDDFLTRGSVAGGDLQLFTIDNSEVYGVSHGGAYSVAGGLVNSTFAGWAAGIYNGMKPRITGAGQLVAPGGLLDDGLGGLGFIHGAPGVGLVYGPRDIVSCLAWDVDPNATTATIITSLGGLPSIQQLPPATDIPEPGTLGLVGLGLAALLRRRRTG